MINLAPASSDALIRLRQGDEIQLGALALKVFLHDGAAVTYDERMATPETIVMNRDSLADTLLTTEGQPRIRECRSSISLPPRWRTVFPAIRSRHSRRKA